MSRIVASREMKIADESDVALVRQVVRAIALERGFDSFATAAVTTATSELTRNVWIHGGGGRANIVELEERGVYGISVVFVDDGEGILDLERALIGGHSTKRSLGLGLSGSKRLVDEFEIETKVGQGTTVKIIKWARSWRR